MFKVLYKYLIRFLKKCVIQNFKFFENLTFGSSSCQIIFLHCLYKKVHMKRQSVSQFSSHSFVPKLLVKYIIKSLFKITLNLLSWGIQAAIFAANKLKIYQSRKIPTLASEQIKIYKASNLSETKHIIISNQLHIHWVQWFPSTSSGMYLDPLHFNLSSLHSNNLNVTKSSLFNQT